MDGLQQQCLIFGRVTTVICFYCLCTMDIIGTAPEMSVDSLIDAISDRNVKNALREMQAQSVRQFHMYNQTLKDCVDEIKVSFRTEMQSFAAANACAPPAPVGAQQYPPFIHATAAFGGSGASSPHLDSSTSNQSLSATSSMTDRPDVVCEGGHIIGLKCLFCPHYHFIEKSHYQHFDRLLTRVESGEPYQGRCVIPDSHWLYHHYGVGQSQRDSVVLFIRRYLSHLHSGNDKNIHPERAIQLVAWLDSHHKT